MGRLGGPEGDLPTRPVPYPPYDGTQPCRRVDPETFFPKNSRESYYSPRMTRPICADCPFLQPCRDYAISYDVDGFWGGMSKLERRAERERLGIAPITVATSDARMMRQLIAEIDDGVLTAAEVAVRVGCAPETVHRFRKLQRQEVA